MSQNPEIDPDATWNAEIDPADPAVAWNFGTRELTDAEYDRFAEANRRDLDRVYAAREADAEYAEWKAANPEAAAQAEAEFHAAHRAADPLLYGEATPEAEQAVHEAGGWFGYEADRTAGPEPEPVSLELDADPGEMTAAEIKTHLAEVAPIECAPDLAERARDWLNSPAVDAEPELDEPEPEIG